MRCSAVADAACRRRRTSPARSSRRGRDAGRDSCRCGRARARRFGAGRRSTGSTQPARCCSSSTLGQRAAGLHRLGQRADAALAQLRHQRAGRRARSSSHRRAPNAGRRPRRRARRRAGRANSRPGSARPPAASRRVSSVRGRCQAMPARSHSRLSTARSKPSVWPITTRVADDSAAELRPELARRRARRRLPRRRCRGCAVAAPGSARPAAPGGATALPGRCVRRRGARRRSRRRRALPASRPVVSVSMTTASSAISGVAAAGGDHCTSSRSVPAASSARVGPQLLAHGGAIHALRSARHGCCTASP